MTQQVVCISLKSLLSTLKPCQLEAIKHTQAPKMILAGAGTGNTTTITAKIAYMVEKANNLEYKTFINSKMNKLIQK
jgi:superfamily I DNA/RNA helicase